MPDFPCFRYSLTYSPAGINEIFMPAAIFDSLVKSQFEMAKKKVQDQGVANPEECSVHKRT